MAPKRKPDGNGKVESLDEFAKPKDIKLESSAKFAKPVYLVVPRNEAECAYSVLKIQPAGGREPLPLRAQFVADLPGTDPGMSFTTAHSKDGSWIVGVGGELSSTVIFDPSTLQTLQGPRLLYPKHEPVLVSHGSKVYILSRCPRLVPYLDFEPWFESLNLSKGVSVSSIEHEFLTPPPFFPSRLDPFEFRNPPEIEVFSYVAVGSYILLSPQPELRVGTYAFHVVNKSWEKIHDDNLPFVGQAVPLGGSLFAACLKSNDDITASASVLHMSIKADAVSTPSLSIQEFPVSALLEKLPLPFICPLGKGSFCSIRLASVYPSHRRSTLLKKVTVISTVFRVDNIQEILAVSRSQGAMAKDVLVTEVKKQSHTYRGWGRSRLVASALPVVAALSMDTQNIERFEWETAETTVNRATNNIFDAPVLGYWTGRT